MRRIDLKNIVWKEDKYYVSQKGDHVKFRKFGNPILTVIVPANKKEIPFGTFKSILRQSKLIEKI